MIQWIVSKWRWYRSEERQWVKNAKRQAPDMERSEREFLDWVKTQPKDR